VLDAVWASEKIFMVGRVNDGTRHDGFAMYVCETLNDYGFRGKEVMVNVIDIVRLKNTGDWESIGSTVW
jgi:cytochrome c biogenesis protein ResB